MSKSFVPVWLLAVLWCSTAMGKDITPNIRLTAADIMTNSIKQVRWSTNGLYTVKWRYTEAGAKRMVEFFGQHPGTNVCIRVGNFTTPPFIAPGLENPDTHEDWRPAWIERGTDKFINLTEAEAKLVMAGLMKK